MVNFLGAIAQNADLMTLFNSEFMQRAIIGSLLMGLLGGLLGSFVTLRQLSFFSHAVSHAALVGIVMGALLQINPTFMLLPFTLIFGIGVLFLIDKTNLASDNILSIVLSGALALGIILSNFIQGYRGNLMKALFGDILAIDHTDIILVFVLLIISTIFLLATYRQQILLTLSPSVAKIQGVPVQLYRYLFVVLLSMTVAVSIPAVGVLLVNAFLVIPASTAKLFTHQFWLFIIMSVVVGAISSIVGIITSGIFNFASGPSIVLIQFLMFLMALVFSHVKNMK
jgi:zinc transport system permease protein